MCAHELSTAIKSSRISPNNQRRDEFENVFIVGIMAITALNFLSLF